MRSHDDDDDRCRECGHPEHYGPCSIFAIPVPRRGKVMGLVLNTLDTTEAVQRAAHSTARCLCRGGYA